MSVGKGSIKRAAETTNMTVSKDSMVTKTSETVTKKSTSKKPAAKKVANPVVEKETKPQAAASLQQEKHYGLGSQLPIYLM